MVQDLVDKNREPCAVWPGLTQLLPAHVVSREDRRAFFEGDAYEGWKRFYEHDPEAVGLVTVSRVGLSREKGRAMFSMASRWPPSARSTCSSGRATSGSGNRTGSGRSGCHGAGGVASSGLMPHAR